MIYSFILLQAIAPLTDSAWGSILTQGITIAGTALLILIVQHFGKGVLGRSDERFKILEERLNQADRERDELGKDINSVREDLRKSETTHLLALNDIKHQYTELMRIFQAVEASNKEEKGYLKNLIELLQKRDK